jgi:hypothetical protein
LTQSASTHKKQKIALAQFKHDALEYGVATQAVYGKL